MIESRSPQRLVAGLLLCAPVVAEFASGNLPLTLVWLLVVYVPFYGAGAVLVRELGRRSRRPWPVMLLLGLAYGVFEEALVSVSLFNPDYAGLRLLDFGWLPALGMGAWWTLFVVVLHAVWSIAVPIVLIESLAGELVVRPWLERRGLAGMAVVFVLGAWAVAAVSRMEDPFTPTVWQLLGAALVLMFLVGAAATVAQRQLGRASPDMTGPISPTHSAPALWHVVLVAGAAATVFYASAARVGTAWWTIGALLLVCVAMVWRVAAWSGWSGWGPRHRLALATGALLPHVAFSLVQEPLVDVPGWLDVAGDVVFAAAVGVVTMLAWRLCMQRDQPALDVAPS